MTYRISPRSYLIFTAILFSDCFLISCKTTSHLNCEKFEKGYFSQYKKSHLNKDEMGTIKDCSLTGQKGKPSFCTWDCETITYSFDVVDKFAKKVYFSDSAKKYAESGLCEDFFVKHKDTNTLSIFDHSMSSLEKISDFKQLHYLNVSSESNLDLKPISTMKNLNIVHFSSQALCPLSKNSISSFGVKKYCENIGKNNIKKKILAAENVPERFRKRLPKEYIFVYIDKGEGSRKDGFLGSGGVGSVYLVQHVE